MSHEFDTFDEIEVNINGNIVTVADNKDNVSHEYNPSLHYYRKRELLLAYRLIQKLYERVENSDDRSSVMQIMEIL